jgi:tetratricopeptide (TPR) repeat protein
MRHRLSRVAALAVALVFAGNVGLAHAAVDKREMQAREAFGAGRYQEALDLFAKLYAEKLHPNYLRNIGRCYQNLGQPDQAITSFKDYLRKGKTIKPDERAEVEGYIKEMDDLKRQREAEAEAAAAAHAQPQAKPAPPEPRAATASTKNGPSTVALGLGAMSTSGPVDSSSTAPGATLVGSAQPRPVAEENHPVYTRWWFWTLIGGVVVGGVSAAAALGVFTKKQDAPCMTGLTCGQ